MKVIHTLTCLLSAFVFLGCERTPEVTQDRASIDRLLSSHALSTLPLTATDQKMVSTDYEDYDGYHISFICGVEGFAEFIRLCPGAPAHDNDVTPAMIIERIKEGPSAQLWKDRRHEELPGSSEITATLQSDGRMSVVVEIP